MLTFKFVIPAKMGIDGWDYYAAAVWLSVRLQKVAAVINPKWPLLLRGSIILHIRERQFA